MDVETLLDQNYSDFEVSKTIKKEIKNYLASLPTFFKNNQGKNFLVNHTKNIDTIIINIYKYILRKTFGVYMPLINTIPVTIVAMGSYGREQLSIYSDIDLLIVYKETPGYNLQEIMESFIQILWDSGLKPGHRVHEIDTLFDAANEDHTIKTALLESRFIYGSNYLWVNYEHVLKRIRRHEPKAYIREKIAERESVRKKSPFNMQPDIKNAPGGLRDANLLFWIAKVLYNVTRIRDLPASLISENEYRELRSSMEFLFRIRSALHLSAGRKMDRLVLEYIPDVAGLLGYSQRQTVQKTFEAMHHIDSICSIMIRRLTNPLFYSVENLLPLRSSRISANHYFCSGIHYGSLHARALPILDLIEEVLPVLDETEAFDTTFLSMFKFAKSERLDKTRLYEIIHRLMFYRRSALLFQALYDANQLFRIVQPLRKVAYLPQFDGYHTQPVDLHSIKTLKALEDIRDPRIGTLFVMLDERQKALLRLTAFLHDCGKGRKMDHSRLGASMIRRYAQQIGFTPQEAETVYTLILYHTLMSNTAHREDIYSEKVIFSFTAKIRSREILDMLYILTYADIASVSENAWSPNNAKLLHELYLNACEALQKRAILSETARRNKKETRLKKMPLFGTLPRLLQKKILSIESNLFFLKHNPHEIISIASWVNTLEGDFDYRIHNTEALSVEIVRKKSVNLGYILSKLANLNVVSMDIFYLFNGIKFFRIEFDETVTPEELLYVRQILDDTLVSDRKATLPAIKILPREIRINCHHSRSYAKMQVTTTDQKGLMANIITIFDDIGIDIASAKIQTIKKRARNLFLIEKNGHFCTNRELVVERLTSKNK